MGKSYTQEVEVYVDLDDFTNAELIDELDSRNAKFIIPNDPLIYDLYVEKQVEHKKGLTKHLKNYFLTD